MKRWIVIALAAGTAGRAKAEPEPDDRCSRGIELAHAGDLPRAALYLESCDPQNAEGERAAADVQRKLRASQLSALSIVTNPSGLTVETDALPGERFTAPATVWTKAGTYKIRVIGETRTVETTTTVGAHARASIVIEAGAARPPTPKDGKADFTDGEPIEPAQSGPPPAVKHASMLPCKYDGCDTHGGEELADPFALRRDASIPHPAANSFGIRAGAIVAGHAGGSRIGQSFALVSRFEAPWEDISEQHPFTLDLRFDWSRRGGDDERVDVFGTSFGISRVIADPDAAWISLGLAMRGELRFGDPMQVNFTGVAGAAFAELALRRLPIVVGVRYEQGVTELSPGTREHAFVVELGADYRVFHYRY